MSDRTSRELECTLEVLRPLWDIVEGRVAAAAPPDWCERRGWSSYLLALSDDDLRTAERLGLDRALELLPQAPASLRELATTVARQVAPFHTAATFAAASVPTEHVPLRKRAQLEALLAACRVHFPRLRRVIELGAGRGHATRAIAAEMDVPVVGIERDARLVRRARELLDGDEAQFSVADGEGEIDLRAGDLALGLHACGGLGDALVRHAARASAHVLLVSCCLQKISMAIREPLSATAQRLGLRLRRSALGLTNLAPLEDAARAESVMRGRQTRHALRILLAARGEAVSPGEESRGVHRRKFQSGLPAAAAAALANRDLEPATAEELCSCTDQAQTEHAHIRRLSLPRAMLGRVIEQGVILDRATFLEEHGYEVRVQPLFARSISPRNLAVLATAPSS